jgi:hypothetical protein
VIALGSIEYKALNTKRSPLQKSWIFPSEVNIFMLKIHTLYIPSKNIDKDIPSKMIVGFSGSSCSRPDWLLVWWWVVWSILILNRVMSRSPCQRMNRAKTTQGARWCLSLERWPSYIAGNMFEKN